MYYDDYAVSSSTSNLSDLGTYGIIAFVLAVVGALLLYFLFLDPKKEKDYNGFVKKLYNFLSFKTMTLEMFLKIIYLFSAVFITLISLSFISRNFISFILILVIGNIVARIVAEWSLILLMIYKRLNDIHNDLSPKKSTKKED